MRAQLQRDAEHAASIVLFPGPEGAPVTVAQVLAALRTLVAHVPRGERQRAAGALHQAEVWISARVPHGWNGRYGHTFLFDETDPYEGWRFDVENLTGTNLVT